MTEPLFEPRFQSCPDGGFSEMRVWHDEAERLRVWGTLDPPDACMCLECVIPDPEDRP